MKRYLNATFASLGSRNYRLFFIGQSISVPGTWMQKFAQAWLVLELTDSGVWLGITVAVQQLPTLLVGLWGGVLVDRFRARTVLLCTAAAGAVPALLLGILTLTDHIRIEAVLCLALMTGFVESMDRPARHSLPGDLVPSDQLANAVSLANVAQNSGKAVGPAIAGFCIAAVGVPFTFFLNAVSFIGVMWGLLLMNPAELRSPEPVKRARGQVRAGLRYVRTTPHLLGPLALLATVGLLAYNFQVILPLLGRDTFGGDARTVGLLVGSFGAGSVIGGLALAGVLTPSLRRVVSTAIAFAALLVLTSLSPTFAIAMVAVFLVGGGSVVFKVIVSTWLQLTADPSMRGRVLSLLVIALAGTSPVGAPLVGWLTHEFGSRFVFLTAGVLTGVAALVAHYYLRHVTLDLPISPATDAQAGTSLSAAHGRTDAHLSSR